MALLVQSGAQDWSMDRPEVKNLETIHLHHMVPEQRLKKWFPGSGDDYQQRRRIANFAPISAKKNQKFGAKHPELVLDELGNHAASVLTSHCADEDTLRSAFSSRSNFGILQGPVRMVAANDLVIARAVALMPLLGAARCTIEVAQ